MPDLKYRRFTWLKPGTLNTFTVKAISGINQSEESEIEIKTSGFSAMAWTRPSDKVIARPVFWNRTIVITWSPILDPLRIDYYRLFRKPTVVPTAGELADYSTDNDYWVEDTGRKLRRVDHILGSNPDIVKEVVYYYWVWAFDKVGNPSAHYLGGSGPNTTPDNAEFGKPEKPTFYPGQMLLTVQHQKVVKWLADMDIILKPGVGGAEGYWVQRKQSLLPLWGPAIWIDHDGDQTYQSQTMQNFIAGVKYDFRARAVNVPIALVSEWKYLYNVQIPYDDEEPDEIELVDARRFLRKGLQIGEYIRVQWKRPDLAVVAQQIQRYEIFRLIGTESEATTKTAEINTYPAGTAEVYDEMNQIEGTRFVDDNIEPLEEGSVVGFHFNADYDGGDTEEERKTATYPGGTILGTLHGTATFTNLQAQDETWSLSILANGDYISFSNTGNYFNSSEGFIDLYVWYDPAQVEGMRVFTAYYDSDNYFELYYSVGRYIVNHRSGGSDNTAFVAWLGGAANSWVRLRARWDVANQILQTQILENGWGSNGGGSLSVFDGEPTEIRVGSPANNVPATEYYIDNLDLFTTYDPPADYGEVAQQYYHYWVRAVDISGLVSPVTMLDSHDQVSFEKPEAPTNLDIVQNVVGVALWKLQTMKFTWDPVDEAVWYRVKMRMKRPGGSNFGAWLYTPRLNEAVVSDVDDDNPDGVPKYVFPFPVIKDTTVEWAVSAENRAGKTWSAVSTETINEDDEPPGDITGLTGNCYGINFFGIKLWMSVELRWDDRPWYEGISSYEVYYYNAVGSWESLGFARPTILPSKKVHWWRMGMPIKDSHKFKVVTTDGDGNSTESNILIVPWSAWWNFNA